MMDQRLNQEHSYCFIQVNKIPLSKNDRDLQGTFYFKIILPGKELHIRDLSTSPERLPYCTNQTA